MKITVRHEGRDLEFPSFRDFAAMYQAHFVGPDDLVRREGSERWVKAGEMPELRALYLYETNRRRTGRLFTFGLYLMLGLFALAILLQLFILR